MKDYYQILGISRSASETEIKSAYKKLAVKYHPDKNPDSEAQFKDVNEAYSTLNNESKKKVYDNKMSFSYDFKRWSEAFGASNTATNFHKTVNRKVPSKGQDIRVNFTISFIESIIGTDKLVDITRTKRCPLCDGTGASKQKQCTTCKGKGAVRRVHKAVFIDDDNSIQVDVCNDCNGTGLVIDTPCTMCKGETILPDKKRLTISIPPGMEDGNFVKLVGFGSAGRNGGENGDIFVYISVDPDPKYERKGNDVYTSYGVSPSDLVLGREFEAELLGKKVKVVIPKGTRSTAKIKLNNQGIKNGSLYITFNVLIPTDPSDDEIELYEKLRELEWNCGN